MTESSNFKHIKVNSQDVDEVIRVGVSSTQYRNDSDVEQASAQLEGVTVQGVPQSSQSEVHDTQTPSAKKQTQYSETTLEDLENSKMSGMQKAIVGVALAAVVVFVVYFVVSLNF